MEADLEKRGRGQQNDGAVDGPADEHGDDGIDIFIAELAFDHLRLFVIPLPALDDLGVEEQIVRHHDRPEDSDDEGQGAGRDRGHRPAGQGLRPVDMDEEDLIDERKSDERDKPDYVFFEPPVGI